MRGSMRTSRMTWGFFLAAALALAPAASWAAAPQGRTAPLSDLTIRGLQSLSTSDVRSIVAPEGLVDTSEEALGAAAESLLARLATEGRPFATVRIDWRDVEEGVDLEVDIHEGPEARLSSLTVDAGGAVPPPVGVGARGEVLSEGVVEREAESLLGELEDSGYPFASVRVSGAGLSDGGVAVRLSVDEGPATRFARLAVSGNTVTRARVVEREAGILPGEPYSASKVADVRPRLEKLGFFASVSEPIVTVDPITGLATVGVRVEEGRTSRVLGVLGYAPGTEEQESEFTGTLDIGLGNIAGTGREASARWQRIRRGYTKIAFSYNEPWLLGAPVDVGIQGEQTVNDTVYTTSEGDLLVSARVGDRTRVTWSVGAERYVPGAEDESTTTSYRAGMAGEYDGTDAPGNPTRGLLVRGSATYAAKKGGADERSRSGTFGVDASTYVRTFERQVIAVRFSGAAIVSTEEDVPFHELLTLGGASSLRGYREEQFRGTRVALGSTEYRFLLSRRSRALVFVDVGYYYRGGSNFAKGTKLGYGIGLRGETRLGIIALDYGLGEGDGLLDGKLHVGLIREF